MVTETLCASNLDYAKLARLSSKCTHSEFYGPTWSVTVSGSVNEAHVTAVDEEASCYLKTKTIKENQNV